MQRLVRAAHTQRVGRPNRSKQTPNRGKRGMNMTKVKPSIANTSLNAGRRRFPLTLWVVVLLVLLLLSVLSSITFGPVDIAIPDVARILVCRIFRSEPAQYAELLQSTTADIIWNIRFPRVLMAMVVGAGLSVSGVVMQAVVRNPLADPYVLGLSSGASLGATLAILLGAFSWFGNYGVSVGAFLGSLVTALFVFTVAFSGKSKGNTIKLLLAGMAVSAICSAFTNFVIYTASDAEGIRSVTFWTMGGMTSASWNLLGIPFVVVLLGVAFFLTQFRVLNTLLIGDESALTLGIQVATIRKVYLVFSSAITGVAVALSGTIGFVGLIIPHVVRMLVGSDHRRVLVLSTIVGSIFLIWCDVAARMVLGNEELPIGIVTAMIGGPFFVWLMLTKSYGFGDE